MSTPYWRINPFAMIAAAITLISVFLPWWGIYETVALGTFLLGHWTLYNPPGAAALRRLGSPMSRGFLVPLPASTISQDFTLGSIIVLVLALVVASLALTGSLTMIRKYLIAGLVLSVITTIIYGVAVGYLTANYCLTPLCASGPIGTGVLFDGTIYSWGFEIGFYTFILSIVILGLALILNNSLARTTAVRRPDLTVPAGAPSN